MKTSWHCSAREANRPIVAVVNKVRYREAARAAAPILNELASRHAFAEIMPVSALHERDVQHSRR